MRLMFKHPEGTPTMLFPKVGEWLSGTEKEVSDPVGRFLLEKFGGFIFPVGEEKPAPKKAKAKETKAETEDNDLKRSVEGASKKIQEFYKFEGEGGED